MTTYLAPIVDTPVIRRDGSRERVVGVLGFSTELAAWLVSVKNDRGHVADTKGRHRTVYIRKRGRWWQVTKPSREIALSRRQMAHLNMNVSPTFRVPEPKR